MNILEYCPIPFNYLFKNKTRWKSDVSRIFMGESNFFFSFVFYRFEVETPGRDMIVTAHWNWRCLFWLIWVEGTKTYGTKYSIICSRFPYTASCKTRIIENLWVLLLPVIIQQLVINRPFLRRISATFR